MARLAAGAVLAGVDHVLDGPPAAARLAVSARQGITPRRIARWASVNNIAVGAAYARSRGCERVAIVDYDVHHGNGTQWAFYEDPTVLFVSSHQPLSTRALARPTRTAAAPAWASR